MNKVTRGLVSALLLLTLVLSLCTALADDEAKLTVVNPEADPEGHSTETLLVLDSSLSEDTDYRIKVSIPDKTWNITAATDSKAENFSFGNNINGINGLRVSDSKYYESGNERWVELVISTKKTQKGTLEPGVYEDPDLTVYGSTFDVDENGEYEGDVYVSGITFVIGPCVWYNDAEAVTRGDSCELQLYLVGDGLSFNDYLTAEQFSVSGNSGYTVDGVVYESEKELTVTLKTDDGYQAGDADLSNLNLRITDSKAIVSEGNAEIDYKALYVNHEEPENEDPNSNDGRGEIKNQDGETGANGSKDEKNPEEIEQSTGDIPADGTEPDGSIIDTVPDETNPDDIGSTDDELSIGGEDSGIDQSGTDQNDTAVDDNTGTDDGTKDSADGENGEGDENGESGEFPLIPVIIGVVIVVCAAAIAAAVIIIMRKKEREQKLETINNSESILAGLKTDPDVEDITVAFGVENMNQQQQTQMPINKPAEPIQRASEPPKMEHTMSLGANMSTTVPIMSKTQATIKPAGQETKPELSALPELQVASFTNVGKRESQQDSKDYRMLPDGVLAVVADGMGGLMDGDKVSKCVVTSMLKDVESLRPGQLNGVLRTLILRANDDVNQMLGPDKIYRSGSTMVAVLVRDGYFHWASIGDSRIYLYRDGNALQVNQEHTYEVELFNRASNGDIPYEAIKKDPQRRGLTSFFGMGQLKYVDMSNRPIKIKHGDRILLLTDGVFNRIPEDALAEIIRKNEDAKKLAETLEKEVLALNDPVQDNFTAIVIAI